MLDDPNGVFTPKHAGEILKLVDIKQQLEVARLIEKEGLSVDQTKAVIEQKKQSVISTVPQFSLVAKRLLASINKQDFSSVSQDEKKKYAVEIEELLNELSQVLKN